MSKHLPPAFTSALPEVREVIVGFLKRSNSATALRVRPTMLTFTVRCLDREIAQFSFWEALPIQLSSCLTDSELPLVFTIFSTLSIASTHLEGFLHSFAPMCRPEKQTPLAKPDAETALTKATTAATVPNVTGSELAGRKAGKKCTCKATKIEMKSMLILRNRKALENLILHCSKILRLIDEEIISV
ncbi:hypothetical protein [Microcystis aeruginosa]|uniref:hypothetical protein n=2 Tax=Microcystis aeruginosa TaxID=1126 RepID=UPI001EF0EA66|nr:hypothetical protein [Microcystis aeruginosa]